MNHLEAIDYCMSLCARHEVQALELARNPALVLSKDGLWAKADEAAKAGLRLREVRDYLTALRSLEL